MSAVEQTETPQGRLEGEIRQLPDVPYQKIRDTVFSDEPIVVGSWVAYHTVTDKYCGCLMMDGYLVKNRLKNGPPESMVSWALRLKEFYHNSITRGQITEMANAFDDWAKDRFSTFGFLNAEGRDVLRHMFTQEDARREEA